MTGPGLFKYKDLAPKDACPALTFDLPELQYPARMNAVQMLFEAGNAAGWERRTVFIQDDVRYSFAETETLVHRHMAALRALGVAAGDTVIRLVLILASMLNMARPRISHDSRQPAVR